jgi:protein-S-isoprenylcysteine O-methyltransferase Ste14
MDKRLRFVLQLVFIIVMDAVIYAAGGPEIIRRPAGLTYLVLWTVWALATALGRKPGKRSPYEEANWFRILFAVIAFAVYLWVAPWEYIRLTGPIPRDGVLAWVGLGLFAAGIALHIQAMRALKGYFTVGLGAQSGHTVTTTGPYRFVRHPGYLAYIIGLTGLGLALGSIAALVMIAPITMYILWRIPREERGLVEQFGDGYRAYGTRTRWKLMPGVY